MLARLVNNHVFHARRGRPLGHAREAPEEPLQLLEPAACRGIGPEHAFELAHLVRGGLAVEDRMHQLIGARNGHLAEATLAAGRRSPSRARMRLRASNSRDFTVFTSMPST